MNQRIVKKKRLEIAIIGAGPSGIKAAQELLSVFPEWRTENLIAVFEESDRVGGIWHRNGRGYRPNYGDELLILDADYPASSIPVECSSQPVYSNLKANVPKDLMNFEDLPYPRDVNILASPDDIEAYFQEYTKAHNLSPFIRFCSRVTQCEKLNDGKGWRIVTANDNDEILSRRLLVCTGHHRKPYIPASIRGIRHFKGRVLHSSSYQSPESLLPSASSSIPVNVLIVGGGISGADIAKLCGKHPNARVTVSVRNWRTIPHAILVGNLRKEGTIRAGIDYVDDSGKVHFHESLVDGIPNTPVKPDVIIFATGYRYSFPFLDAPKEVERSFCDPDGFKTQNLYLRMLYSHDTTLAFMGIPTQVLSPMMMVEYQARWYAEYLKENKGITHAEMVQEINSRAGDTTQDALQILPGFIRYCNQLACMTKGLDTFWRHFFKRRFLPLAGSIWQFLIVPRLYPRKEKSS